MIILYKSLWRAHRGAKQKINGRRQHGRLLDELRAAAFWRDAVCLHSAKSESSGGESDLSCLAKAAGKADLSICQVFGPKQSKRRSMPTITRRQQAAKPAVDAPVHCEVGRQ